jgi:hypothetical protein
MRFVGGKLGIENPRDHLTGQEANPPQRPGRGPGDNFVAIELHDRFHPLGSLQEIPELRFTFGFCVHDSPRRSTVQQAPGSSRLPFIEYSDKSPASPAAGADPGTSFVTELYRGQQE